PRLGRTVAAATTPDGDSTGRVSPRAVHAIGVRGTAERPHPLRSPAIATVLSYALPLRTPRDAGASSVSRLPAVVDGRGTGAHEPKVHRIPGGSAGGRDRGAGPLGLPAMDGRRVPVRHPVRRRGGRRVGRWRRRGGGRRNRRLRGVRVTVHRAA